MTNACRGHVDGAGGDGSPGIVQLHTNAGLPDIILPGGSTLFDVSKPTPLCDTSACRLVPVFGRLSRARSDWIALGEGGFDSGAAQYKDVVFDFGGIDTVSGMVNSTGGVVDGLPPLIGPDPLGGALPAITASHTIVMDAGAITGGPNQFLLDEPELLEDYLVELREQAAPTNLMRFNVKSASYDNVQGELTLMVDPTGPALTSFVPAGTIEAELQPAFFRVFSDGAPDVLPTSSTVQITFEATEADQNGLPDPTAATGMTSDISTLNGDPNNRDFRFIRFEVLFDIDAQATGLTPNNPIPSIDFFRVPFRYN